ncbi:kinase phosphorylation protein-domain-containing protein [Talaromyces proteolyticus]|uniref:Kinase phosphorylation protein-domain-containing protein n=1 Tax=Talaromyces proteolyticus TaxID=1131652 RepID=A0AAD4PYF4_9EURO|nr:kinase phosphorylation protein-domain-containing protein [Talaromyces proteolyticus]KAH8695113.1 kinase phosphorylation protein-domain-containing protein [Talaromyces proteolyticus]
MDLVAGVRKEGSRGGRGDFKWSDVKESSHRENYLGHSLMAPVGRWQQGRDLNWYAKSADGSTEEAAKRELDDERRRVKAAEQEALARALGLPTTTKTSDANLTPLGGNEMRKAVQGNVEDDEDVEGGRGIGFGSYGGRAMDGMEGETLAPVGLDSESGHRRNPRDGRSRRDRSKDRDSRRGHHRDRRDHRSRDRYNRDSKREVDREKSRDRTHREDRHGRSEHRNHRREDRRRPSKSRSRSPHHDSRRERKDTRDRDSHDRRRESDRPRPRRLSSPRPSSTDRLGEKRERRYSDHYSPSGYYRRNSRQGDDIHTAEIPRERRKRDPEDRDRDRGRSYRERRD